MADHHNIPLRTQHQEQDHKNEAASFPRYETNFYPYPFFYYDSGERRMLSNTGLPRYSQAGALSRPLCEAANTVYEPTVFYSEPSTSQSSNEIEVSEAGSYYIIAIHLARMHSVFPMCICTVERPNKGHVGIRSFVLYREVSFIRRLKCTV